MANIDSQINDRMNAFSGNPQALMQRYAQTQELVDLLALQKMTNDRKAATAAIQGAMQPPTGTVKGQLEQEAMQGARNDVLRGMAPGIQQQGQRMAQMQSRAAMGLPAQAAPNMARMAEGGIVGYAQGGMPEVGAKSKGPIPQLSPEENAQMLKYLEGLKKFDYYDKNPDKVSPEGRQALELERRMFEEQFPNAFKQKVNDMMYGPARGMAMGGEVKRYQTGAMVESDLSRFGIEDENELTPDEARELDLQARDVGMVYGPFDFARDVGGIARDIKRRLPTPQRIPAEAILRRDMIDMTGSLTPDQQQRRMEEIEKRVSELPPEERMPQKEAALPQNEGITAGMYMTPKKELTMAQKLMQLPKVAREPAKREEKGLDIDFRALREFLAGGAGQTSTAGALASGAARLGAFQTAERTRQDEIQQQLAERQLERELADAEASQLVYKLGQDYRRSMDEAAYKVAQEELKALPLNPDYQREMQAAEKQYGRSPVELRVAKETIRKRYVDAAVQAARIPAERQGSGLGAIAGDAGIVG